MLHALVLCASLVAHAAAAPAQRPANGPPAPAAESLSEAYFLFLQAHALEARDDTAGAIATYRKAAELAPTSADIHAELASLFAKDGKIDDAVKEAKAALALDSRDRIAHRILGFVQAELADNARDEQRAAALADEGIDHLEVVAAEKLVDPGADLTLGRLYVRAGRDENAIATLNDFLLDHPDYAPALQLLAQAYTHSHQLAPAIEILKDLTAEQPAQPRLLSWLAELREQNAQWKEAAAVWGRLADGNPRVVPLRARQANALMNAGDTDRAEQAYRQVIATEPSNADALNSLGYLLVERGTKLDEAVDLIRRALAIEADNPSFLDSLGWAYFKQAKLDEARAPLVRAATAQPASSVIQDHLAEVYFQLKRYRDAADTWDRALAGDRNGIDAAEITKKRDRARALAGK